MVFLVPDTYILWFLFHLILWNKLDMSVVLLAAAVGEEEDAAW